jgi:excinuclease ABC subunit C
VASLKEQIAEAPQTPGVYLLKDRQGKIIYVGKARNLRDRLRAYTGTFADPRKGSLITRVRLLDCIVTGSEVEALILEENLIKLNKPKYNVRLKDDKKYPYLKIMVGEDYPRIFPTRNLKKDRSILFGPYTSMKSLKRGLKGVKKVFKVRTCKKQLPARTPERPCLEFQMNRCLAPCAATIPRDEYQERVREVIAFLAGKSNKLERTIEKKMWDAAEQENFERAAHLRDQLLALRDIQRHQEIVFRQPLMVDVIGLAGADNLAVASLFKVREGKLIGKENYTFTTTKDTSKTEILETLLRTIYTHTYDLPDEILLPAAIEDTKTFVDWFQAERQHRLRIYKPQRGDKVKLLQFAEKNARVQLIEEAPAPRTSPSVLELQRLLNLPAPPRLIEGVDISNISGKHATGSIVVFEDGGAKKNEYRKFKIRTVAGPDDYKMVEEVLSRRFQRLAADKKRMPDLVLVDGGKGQLSSALKAISDFKVSVLAFAKRTDQLYFQDGRALSIPGFSPALKLLKQIRDESHRFAITFHRQLRRKKTTASILLELPGVGKKRQVALIRHFGSLERLQQATPDEIGRIPGIGAYSAKLIFQFLHPK